MRWNDFDVIGKVNMCDRHDRKPLDHYCLEHEEIVCEQCATEKHAQTPCQSMLLVDASKHVAVKLEASVPELKKLRGASQSILDGKRLDDTLKIVDEAEELLDNYVAELKRKINNAKSLLRPFSELSREERWKLKTVATKKIPPGVPNKGTTDYDEARDLVSRLQEVGKQTKTAREVLNALPGYVDVSVNLKFIDSLSFDGNPILVTKKGQPVEKDDDIISEISASEFGKQQETVYLIEKSHFSLEHCTDIVILEDYIIASVGDSVQKRDRKRMSFRQALTAPGAGKLCLIGETSEVTVLQKNGYITVFETYPNLQPLFRLLSDAVYHDISYLESTMGDYGCPKDSPVFVVCYTNRDPFVSDCVSLIQPKRTKYPGKLPSYHVTSRILAESAFGKTRARFVDARTLATFQGRYIIIGALKGITCINKAGVLIWTVDTYKKIVHLMTYRTLVFVCVHEECKIMTIGTQGLVIEENVLPPIDIQPRKLSAYNDTLMARYHDKYEWIIFKKMYEDVN